jgi:TonB family protein
MALARQYSPLQYCTGSSYPVASWQQIRDFKQKYSRPVEDKPEGGKIVVTDPSVATAPAIEYPPALQGTSETGSVAMLVAVASDGTLLDALVVCSSHQAFSDAALASAKTAKFNPATRNGLPVADIVVMPFNFRR